MTNTTSSEVVARSKHIYVYGSIYRASLALLAPLVAVIGVTVQFIISDYSPMDYFMQLLSGELSIFRQGVGWAVFGLWIARYWPPALEVISHRSLLAKVDGSLCNAMNESLKLSSITSVDVKYTILRQDIIVRGKEDSVVQSIMFSEVSTPTLIKQLQVDVNLGE